MMLFDFLFSFNVYHFLALFEMFIKIKCRKLGVFYTSLICTRIKPIEIIGMTKLSYIFGNLIYPSVILNKKNPHIFHLNEIMLCHFIFLFCGFFTFLLPKKHLQNVKIFIYP